MEYQFCVLLFLGLPSALWCAVLASTLSDVPTNEPVLGPFTGPDNPVMAELDLHLTPRQHKLLYGNDLSGSKSKRRASDQLALRWPNNTVPFELVSNDFTPLQVSEIQKALEDWQTNTCLTFRPATTSDKNKIIISDGNGCSASLGMLGGTQHIYLDRNGCRFPCNLLNELHQTPVLKDAEFFADALQQLQSQSGVYLHVIGHALGLLHEHQLPDRDQYIEVIHDNILPAMKQWFQIYNKDVVNQYGVPYEYSSVMHYGVKAFSKDGKSPTIRAKDPSRENEIGRIYWKRLSFSDIKVVNMKYKCNAHCAADAQCKEPGYLDKDCKCVCPMNKYCGYGMKECTNTYTGDECDQWAKEGYCDKNTAWMRHNCEKSCGMCPPAPPSTIPPPTTTTTPGPTTLPPPTTTVPTTKAPTTLPPTTTTEERDTSPLPACLNSGGERRCDQFQKRGDCDTVGSWMKVNCAKACNKCPGTCFNIRDEDDCVARAKKGECEHYKADMYKKCALTCWGCTSYNRIRKVCKDDNENCQGWSRTKNVCKDNDYMIHNCKKSCKLCT